MFVFETLAGDSEEPMLQKRNAHNFRHLPKIRKTCLPNVFRKDEFDQDTRLAGSHIASVHILQNALPARTSAIGTLHFATASNSSWIAGWIVGGILFRYVELKQVLRALKSVDL